MWVDDTASRDRKGANPAVAALIVRTAAPAVRMPPSVSILISPLRVVAIRRARERSAIRTPSSSEARRSACARSAG